MNELKQAAFKLANKVGELENDHEIACTILTDISDQFDVDTVNMNEDTMRLKLDKIKALMDYWNRRNDLHEKHSLRDKT